MSLPFPLLGLDGAGPEMTKQRWFTQPLVKLRLMTKTC